MTIETIVNIHSGGSEEDSEICETFSNLDFIPRVGEYFEFYFVRDENHAGYHHRFVEKKFSGIVHKVLHTIEEKEKDPSSRRIYHYISIFLI